MVCNRCRIVVTDLLQKTGIESVKKAIIELIRNKLSEVTVNYSVYLEREIVKDYNYLSNLLTASEGQTIEKYIIGQKIERVKELLV